MLQQTFPTGPKPTMGLAVLSGTQPFQPKTGQGEVQVRPILVEPGVSHPTTVTAFGDLLICSLKLIAV